MNQTVKGQDVKAGMIIKTGGLEDFAVDKVLVRWGAVQVRNHIGWTGLGLDQTVEILGHFNPED